MMKRWTFIIVLFSFIIMFGCGESSEDAYQRAYDEGYTHGYRDAVDKGKDELYDEYERGYDKGYTAALNNSISIAKDAIDDLYGDDFYEKWNSYFSFDFETYIRDFASR